MKNTRAGMTLLEVLIVTILLSFLAFATFTAVRSTITTKEDIDRKTESVQESRAALAIMDRDIRAAFFITAEDLGWNPQPSPNSNNPTEPPAVKPLPVTLFKGEAKYLFFSANSHQRLSADVPEDSQHFVTYQLSKDNLIRAESVRAISAKDRDSSATASYRQFELLTQVKELKFSFWDAKQERWADTWDSEKAEQLDTLPAAVKVEIEYLPDVAATSRRKVETVKITTAIRILQAAFKTGARDPVTAAKQAGNTTANAAGAASSGGL